MYLENLILTVWIFRKITYFTKIARQFIICYGVLDILLKHILSILSTQFPVGIEIYYIRSDQNG